MQEVGGSIPPSSTKSPGASQAPFSAPSTSLAAMEKYLGRYTVFLGIAMIAAGMVVGFGAMFVNPDSPWVRFIALVPFGFLALLTGTVVSLLQRPH
jgi:hypothetical protein